MKKSKYLDIRYYKTSLNWHKYQASTKFIQAKPMIVFCLAAIFPLLIYFVTFPFVGSFFKPFIQKIFDIANQLSSFLHIEHITDRNIKSIITTITSSLTIFLSLLSAIYVFTYREQKTIAPSASTNNRRNTLVILVISLMIFNLIFGFLIVNDYERLLKLENYYAPLEITQFLFSKIIIITASLLWLIYFIINLIKYLFSTMSVDKMLTDSVKQTEEAIDKLVYFYRDKKFKELLEQNYRKLHFSWESVFQNLKYAAENNMNKEFTENISEFKKVIDKLDEDIKAYDINFVSTYLFEEDGVQFHNAYNSALRNNLSLISALMKSQQYNKAHEVVSLYFHMYLETDELLQKIFISNLNDFLHVLDTSDDRQLQIFLEGLSTIPNRQSLIIYKYLLMKLVNKDQMKPLTNLVYTFIEENENNDAQKTLRMKLHMDYMRVSKFVILLQILVKSIEISNYETTGFLIKFLVTNFNNKDIARGLKVLKNNRVAFTKVFEDRSEIEGLEGIRDIPLPAIKINDETFEYCYKKAFVLIYGQQMYSYRQKIWYVDTMEPLATVNLKEEFENYPSSGYIVSKIIKASSKYGLLFFEDVSVIKSIYSEMGVKYPNSNRKESDLSETVNLLLRKILKV
ncbi:hypothetical protein [Priestia megaterium]|uniref:hypothetical protein n=1 Tax=Priestia megaterium TaxID=1404 RepID=UPI0012B9D83F|nr:hypothetical protein [Priestia megaterium]